MMAVSRRTDRFSPCWRSEAGAWRPSIGYLLVAAALVLWGLGYGWLSGPPASPVEMTSAPASLPSAPATQAAGWPMLSKAPAEQPKADEPTIRVGREGDQDPTPDITSFIPKGQVPTMNEVITRLHQAGIRTGLGAFNPPGTRPPMVGLAVPEGYTLPEGYVRHYQATDDGQRIEPILMFAPDRPFFDANNQPIPIPEDRVVTPELAPPGFPIRRIVIPPPVDTGHAKP
ncbi:hypothetical protein HNQ59_001315 [Chitinivorax tropicus]|uniref:Uncharacterized protein n=1 Tax=Chitinivorax tropicus TaxID=714531 RepID=A0A840MI04_9PROT|nr:hypothetical protein [Chitinivorax tropicus]MBB5018030.1 hypothetical protein [Chitinivorax tropicus]